ncbi:MAG: divalent-cation tolerance protein CutA [Thermoplasmata archaeon]|nr:divalent-cation tolerance protein CutA [Thermoplasmata archaeon]
MSPYSLEPIRAVGPVRLVLTTYPSRTAALAAVTAAVERRLAACGNVGAVESRYLWKGRVESHEEAMVVFKTVPKKVGALFEFLGSTHPYEVPEILEIDVPRVDPRYLRYLSATLDRDAPPPPLGGGTRRRAGPPDREARDLGRTRARPHRRSTRTGSRR